MTDTKHAELLDLIEKLENNVRDAHDNRSLSEKLARVHMEKAEDCAIKILHRIIKELSNIPDRHQ